MPDVAAAEVLVATFALAPLLALDWLLLSQGVCRSRVGGEEESEGAGDGGCSVSNNLLSPATSQQNPLMLVNGEDAYTALYHTHNSHTCSTGPPTRNPHMHLPRNSLPRPLESAKLRLAILVIPTRFKPNRKLPALSDLRPGDATCSASIPPQGPL